MRITKKQTKRAVKNTKTIGAAKPTAQFGVEQLFAKFSSTPQGFAIKRGSNVVEITFTDELKEVCTPNGLLALIFDTIYASNGILVISSVGKNDDGRFIRVAVKNPKCKGKRSK